MKSLWVSVGFLWVVFGCEGAVMVAIRAVNAEDDVRSPLNRSGSCPKPNLGMFHWFLSALGSRAI